MRAARIVRRVVAGVLIAVAVVNLALAGWRAYGPVSDSDRVRQQLIFLEQAVDRGAPAQMQQLFPEGAFFTLVLTATAAADLAGGPGDPLLDDARRLRSAASEPSVTSPFPADSTPRYGVFWTGWMLALDVAIARRSGDPTDLETVTARADTLVAALTTSRSPFLEGYSRQYWPCDSVVAVSALAEATSLVTDRPGWVTAVESWRARAAALVDPSTGLLPHQVDADGRAITGPRASSNAIIQTFWPRIAVLTGEDDDQWRRFIDVFVTREGGLVGIREYPPGVTGSGDVDSGPLVAGVSASASVVALAAARTNGDLRLAEDLDREAELLGLPLTTPDGSLRYAGGQLPVGDAFLAWARTRPVPPDATASADAPRARLWVCALPSLAVGGLALLLWWPRRGRGRRTLPSTHG